MISVCMATYNGARFIKEQIDSILPQLASDDELIVSDDGSTDGTLEILMDYAAKDARVRVLKHEKNPAYAKIRHSRNFYYATDNFGNVLRYARGEYIFLSDQDDIWSYNKVSLCMEYLKNYDFVIHAKIRLIHDRDKTEFSEKDIPALPKSWVLHLLNMKWYGCCMAFTKNVLKTAVPFPYKLIGHDYWISALALRFFSVAVLEVPLITYRVHGASVSYRKYRKKSLVFRLLFRIDLISQVAKRGKSA